MGAGSLWFIEGLGARIHPGCGGNHGRGEWSASFTFSKLNTSLTSNSYRCCPPTDGEATGDDLVHAAMAEAQHRGYDQLTLRTYAEVPWNAPFYASCGFIESRAEQLTSTATWSP